MFLADVHDTNDDGEAAAQTPPEEAEDSPNITTGRHVEGFAEETPLFVPLDIPMPEVQNLNHVLPLTSTPKQVNKAAAPSKARLSDIRPRGFLPMEFEDSNLGSSSRTPSRFKQALVNHAKQVKKALSKDTDSSSEGP